MATYESILRNEFPSLVQNDEVFQYVTGTLEHGREDFDTYEDLFDAVGGLLQEIDLDKTEDEIRLVCQELHNLNMENGSESSTEAVRLDAPLQMSEISESTQTLNDDKTIWMAKPASSSTVDKKKLEKAEAKSKQKQEKRLLREEGITPNSVQTGALASASQASNRKNEKMDASGVGKSCDIKIENFDLSFGERCLLKEAELTMAPGRIYGLVGRNGSGKTTLLNMIARGELRIPSHISILHVEQEVVGDDTLALDSVLECDTLRQNLLKEEKELSEKLHAVSPGSTDPSLSSRLSEVFNKLEEIEADRAPARASILLTGLGFTSDMQQYQTRMFSGGWRMRLALARALFSRPDLLLLDEPTNMLDLKAILWLENYLQAWPTTLLVVSHDRQFLNAVSTDVIHLHSQRLETYRGNYDAFVKAKTERLTNQQKEYESQQQLREHVQVFIDRFRYNANRAALVQSKIKMLEKLPKLKPVEKEADVILKFPSVVEKLSPPIIQLDEVDFHYHSSKPLLNKIDVSANFDSRICIVGENGTGKTTLLKLLLGELEPVGGWRRAHRNLRIAHFTQHHVDQLVMEQTALQLLADRHPGHGAEELRRRLGAFGLSGDLATRPVASLSGGQKSRLAFTLMSCVNPNFFILDEPTNHLDVETVEALGKALNLFKGGVILVSHDEALIKLICKELWVCGGGKVKRMEGGFEEYRQILEKEFQMENK